MAEERIVHHASWEPDAGSDVARRRAQMQHAAHELSRSLQGIAVACEEAVRALGAFGRVHNVLAQLVKRGRSRRGPHWTRFRKSRRRRRQGHGCVPSRAPRILGA